jgi:alpha-beta hydrolase superfamily lysophospholipase
MDISTNSELFKTFDSIKLFEQSYSPGEYIKGVIIIIHGLTEHSGFYSRVSRKFSENKYAINLFDLRGHGKSDGSLAFIDSFGDYLNDLSVFLDIVKNRYPKTPLFLLGHGMGGIISALYVIENRPEIRGLILSAPALDMNKFISPFLQNISLILGILFPRWPLVKMNSSALSTDSTVIQNYESDPLIYHGKIYARTCLELIKASKTVLKRGNEIKKPFLVVHGKEDQLFNFEGSRILHEKVKFPDKTIKLYKGLSHSLLFEPEGKEVVTDILQWTDSHVRTT